MSFWLRNLNEFKRKETDIVRRSCNFREFRNCLELGAGSGVQTKMLKAFCDKVVATDLNEQRLMKSSQVDGIERRVLDAELLSEQLVEESFDLIFSSNLLEHLVRPDDCLKGCLAALDDQGLIVHVVPNPTWRSLCTLVHPVAKIRNLLSRLFVSSKAGVWVQPRDKFPHSGQGNNLKLNRATPHGSLAKFKRYLPAVHGVSDGLIEETLRFRLAAWRNLFEKNGLEIITIAKGPVATGHGLGFASLKGFLESVGVSSEYVFVMRKKNEP